MTRGTHTTPLDRALERVSAELQTALVRFPRLNSPHEGLAVIWEEFEELKAHVWANTGGSALAIGEAKQIAAMALRYMLELDESTHQPIPEPVWKNPQKIGVDQ